MATQKSRPAARRVDDTCLHPVSHVQRQRYDTILYTIGIVQRRRPCPCFVPFFGTCSRTRIDRCHVRTQWRPIGSPLPGELQITAGGLQHCHRCAQQQVRARFGARYTLTNAPPVQRENTLGLLTPIAVHIAVTANGFGAFCF